MWTDVLTKPLQGKVFCEMHVRLMNCEVNYKEKQATTGQNMTAGSGAKK
jgi:hypothetical protein